MRKPFVLAWATSPEQVVQFVKGQTTGWSIQSKKHHATFKHIPWNAALQQLICSTSQPNFRREGWCGARGGAHAFLFLYVFTLLYNSLFLVHFLSSVSPVPHWSEVALILWVSPGAFSRILGLLFSSFCWNHSFLCLSFCVVWSL